MPEHDHTISKKCNSSENEIRGFTGFFFLPNWLISMWVWTSVQSHHPFPKNFSMALISKSIHSYPQCGNYRHFLSIRFFTWNQSWRVWRYKNCHLTNSDALNFNFCEFLHFFYLKYTKIENSEALRLPKWKFSKIYFI